MRADHIKGWLAAAQRADKEKNGVEGEIRATETGGPEDQSAQGGVDNWTRCMCLVPAAFLEGELAEEATWQAVVLIPKEEKDYRGICLVEVMEAVKRQFIIAATTFHITSTRPMHR